MEECKDRDKRALDWDKPKEQLVLWEEFNEWAKNKVFVTDAAYLAAWTAWEYCMRQQEEEIARLRKDAERYRWLRLNIGSLQSMRPYHAPKPDALDAAIDAELNKETP